MQEWLVSYRGTSTLVAHLQASEATDAQALIGRFDGQAYSDLLVWRDNASPRSPTFGIAYKGFAPVLLSGTDMQ